MVGRVVVRVETRGDGNVRPARVQFGAAEAALVLSSGDWGGGAAEDCRGRVETSDSPVWTAGKDESRVLAGLGRAGTEDTAGDGKTMRGCASGGGHVIWRL